MNHSEAKTVRPQLSLHQENEADNQLAEAAAVTPARPRIFYWGHINASEVCSGVSIIKLQEKRELPFVVKIVRML